MMYWTRFFNRSLTSYAEPRSNHAAAKSHVMIPILIVREKYYRAKLANVSPIMSIVDLAVHRSVPL